MGAFNDVTEETLRSLAELRAESETVLSLYLDLDPAQFATAPARASEIDSLLDRAHRGIEEEQRPRSERLALREALQRARETLDSVSSLAQGARALALFVCEPLQLMRVLRLSQPAASAVVISDAPFIAPLVEQGPAGRVCVALVDERFARILRGAAERLREAISFGDPVHGRHDQGGWSQARYQRSIQEDVDVHLRRVARVLHDLLRIAPYDRLLIACAEPLWPRVTSKLHPDVQSRLREERLSIDVSAANVSDIERAAAPALAAERRDYEDALLRKLREHRARDGDERAVAGLEGVLQALVQRRVQALLYDARLRAAGVLCPRCGWMGAAGERCPADGEQLQDREDIVEEARQAAVSQAAEALALRDRPELGPLGGIAATLRF